MLWHIWQERRSFFVVYANGEQTYRMRYFEARPLIEILKGEIIFDPDDHLLRERLRNEDDGH